MAPDSRTIDAPPIRRPPLSPVGDGLRGSTATQVAAVLVCGAVLALDLRRWTYPDWTSPWRLLPPLAGLAALALLARAPRETLGLRLSPLPSWRWWAVATVVLLAGTLLSGGLFFLGVAAAGATFPLPLQVRSVEELPGAALRLCVLAPLLEETVYRGVVVPALVPALRPLGAVLASGALFAALHHLYGNAGPDNQVAGFVLAWAFVRSGALWVPIALHAGGNALVLGLHLGLAEGWWTLPVTLR